VWAVVFSNYEPAEVAALYDNEAAADAHADALDDRDGGGWRVARWSVGSTYEPEGSRDE
jgi:hypothetical protein